MKKIYLSLITVAAMTLAACGGNKSNSQAEAAEEAQAPAMEATAEMTAEETADSAETADPVLTAEMERRYFEALVKIADGGKAYALDADGKRSAKAFNIFDEYEKFITDNPQYIRNRYSYDADGKPFNVDFKPSPNGDGWQIQNKPQTNEPIPDVSFSIRPAKSE
jgi:hypothetical protein